MSDLAPVLGHVRRRDWHRVTRGVHRRAGASDLPAWQLVLPPAGRFTHLTAAAVHQLWLPPLPEGLPVFATVPVDASRPQRTGLVVARHAFPAEPDVVDNLRVDPVPELLLACARDLSLLDLVVLVDAALQLGRCDLAAIEAVIRPRRKGAPRLRHALSLADGRSESAWETLLRLLHVTCDIDVEPQHVLREEDGSFVARADLWVCGTNALHEYDGADHLERPRQRKDLARTRRIGNVTWIRRGYTSVEVLHQAVGILRDADLSLGREHRPERIRAWHSLLVESCFTPSGRQRLLDRWGLPGGGRAVRSTAGTGGEQQPGWH